MGGNSEHCVFYCSQTFSYGRGHLYQTNSIILTLSIILSYLTLQVLHMFVIPAIMY